MRVIQNGHSVQSFEYDRFAICKEMGWDYYQFEAQPEFFLQEVRIYLNQISEKMKNPSDSQPDSEVKVIAERQGGLKR